MEQSFVMAVIILLMRKGGETTEVSEIKNFTQLAQGAEFLLLLLLTAPLCRDSISGRSSSPQPTAPSPPSGHTAQAGTGVKGRLRAQLSCQAHQTLSTASPVIPGH